MPRRKLVVLGFIGTSLDQGKGPARWKKWRPSVALTQREDLVVDRFELLHDAKSAALTEAVIEDVRHASPETRVVPHVVELGDPWDFERVYAALIDFARAYPFDPDAEDYLVHITTGTHVAQICLFLLTESRYFPARLLQTSPQRGGSYAIIDLDLSKYDRIASRVRAEHDRARSALKAGIETKNRAFNELIAQIEHVASTTRASILLTGPTGAGKSELARRIFALKKTRHHVKGELVEVNCATLRGDAAMSALFGHKKGAFTGALSDRGGLLKKADGGVLYLDEIGELGLDEQAMLLRAIEDHTFYPMGSDKETSSDFQLVAGTNRDLGDRVASGHFRQDLLARIDLWTFRLPRLADRPEDIPPNLDFELERTSRSLGVNVTMSREARATFLRFAATFPWPGNFRDLAASVTRMATFAEGGRITEALVDAEIARLGHARAPRSESKLVDLALGARPLDRFDRVQLEDVLAVCREARSLADAGRTLFASSRAKRSTPNDSDRVRKYLARFGLSFVDAKRDGA